MKTPLALKPFYASALWGGDVLKSRYGRVDAPSPASESWEVSAHEPGVGVVGNGPFAGRRLDDLVATFGASLVGTKAKDATRFPLLIKLIDAAKDLSVQVHPNETTAPLLRGAEPKTEMWYVLAAEPGAALYAGLRPGVTREALESALASNAAADLLVKHAVRPGEAYFIPGGTVHAIGAGCLVFEVQQSSDTTYRLYDWGRVGADGRPRKLHIAEGTACIDWSATGEGDRLAIRPLRDFASPFFRLRALDLTEALNLGLDGSTFAAVFVERGSAAVSAGGETVEAGLARSVLLPAAARDAEVRPLAADTRLLLVTL